MDRLFAGFGFVYLAVIVAGLFGYIWNIIKLIGSLSDPITAMLIARGIGVFAFPLGAILGFF